MKLTAVFIKSIKEQSRDLWTLVLSLSIAPLFVFLYWLFFGTTSTTYTLLALDLDKSFGTDRIIRFVDVVKNADGSPVIKVKYVDDIEQGKQSVRNRGADGLIVIEKGFTERLNKAVRDRTAPPVDIAIIGDATNPRYAIASSIASSAVEESISAITGRYPPIKVKPQPLGGSGDRSEFEMYVPGLLVLAAIMLMFQTSISAARELESGTMKRLMLTSIAPLELLGGLSLVQTLIGLISVALTFAAALLLGFRSEGPVWVAMLVGCITALSSIGIGLLVAYVAKTANRAFILSNLPLAFLMFFSGAVFPVGKVFPITIAGRIFGLFDLLPPTYGVAALNKVMTLGADLGDIRFEMTGLTVLSLIYFAFGTAAFRNAVRPR